ncbi:nucleotidyltransferase [Corynebacterium sp. sy017]|nr:nucleotidyltransferase [Corynebacterium sp. sy017]TSD91184.1 nucleotidyltransferase [Corynebacterium sp. SY003]
MVLHPSLLELATQAPLCNDIPTVRGVLAESQELMRNAIEHGEAPQELTQWFSSLIKDIFRSPAIRNLSNNGDSKANILFTGAISRGDALPSSEIIWLNVAQETNGTQANKQKQLRSLLKEAELQVGSLKKTKGATEFLSQQQWENYIEKNKNNIQAHELAYYCDAGDWLLQHAQQHIDPRILLVDAISQRPPALSKTLTGLPDKDTYIDIRKDLLHVIIALARWAGMAAQSPHTATLNRIDDAKAAGVLSDLQSDYLREAWHAGLQLQMNRWANRVHNNATTPEALSAIQRSTFGAASRLVADVARSLAHEHNIEI